jgi:CRP/FNR family transcriptional regulator
VRSGTFKSHLALKDGREQVTGFQMAGELLGLDGLASGRHASSAVALEDAEICAIPYAHLSELAAGSTDLQHVISRLMSREIVREHSLMMLLGSMNAEERLAAFLLNISQRMKARGYSPAEFHLRMSRAEIGSYLGMKLETVSRTFSAFQAQGLLEVDKKHVRIRDMDGLTRAFETRVQ